MIRSRLLLFFVVLAGCACDPAARSQGRPDDDSPSTDGPSTQGWKLVWQDEFDGPSGALPSADRWGADVGGDGWGNGQLEYDTARAENASLDGEGHLVITARKERYGGRDYTSARLNTRERFARAYGRFEARIQIPTGRGIWPAFWLLGDNFDSVGWPACGEVDIMEAKGQLPAIVRGSLHGPGYSGGQNVGSEHVVSGGRLYENFHIYAVEWDADRIRWMLDDVVYFEATPAKLPGNARWVFDHPFFIILNVAVGGSFLGPPDSSTVFPQMMKVDYVRVYERTP